MTTRRYDTYDFIISFCFKKTYNLLKLFVKDTHNIKKSNIGEKLQNLNTVPDPETQFVIPAPAPEGNLSDPTAT